MVLPYLLKNVLFERRGELVNTLMRDLLQRYVLQALDKAALLLIQPARQLCIQLFIMAVLQPVPIGNRQRMTQFFLQQRLLVDLIGTRENAVQNSSTSSMCSWIS